MVFINQSPSSPPNGAGCPLSHNVVELSTPMPGPLPESFRSSINSIPVFRRDVQSATDDYEVTVRALGIQVDARGPLDEEVVKTLTHSPLSVVLHSSSQSVPKDWRQVVFGGVRFRVPPGWSTHRETFWGGCPGNIAAGLELSTAETLSNPGCPGPIQTAGYLAADQGMVLGSGPQVESVVPPRATCTSRHRLRICIDPPPTPDDGSSPGHQLNLLTAQVSVPRRASRDQLELGLSGSGVTQMRIFDSLRVSR